MRYILFVFLAFAASCRGTPGETEPPAGMPQAATTFARLGNVMVVATSQLVSSPVGASDVLVRATLRNTGADRATIVVAETTPLIVRLYPTGAPTTSPVFTSRAAVTLLPRRIILEPGATDSITVRIPRDALSAAAVAVGRYRITAELTVGGARQPVIEAGEIAIP